MAFRRRIRPCGRQHWVGSDGSLPAGAVVGRASPSAGQRSFIRAPLKVRFRGKRTPDPEDGQSQVSVAAVFHGQDPNGCSQSVAVLQSAASRDRSWPGTEGRDIARQLTFVSSTPTANVSLRQLHEKPAIGQDRTLYESRRMTASD